MLIRKTILSFIVFALSSYTQAQNPSFDKLEMLFEQGHYKKVYRRANRLLDKPEYDYSLLPKYYKSLSLLQLSQNERWFLNHSEALEKAESLFIELKVDKESEKLFNAHMYELIWVKNDMTAWAADLKRMGKKEQFDRVQFLIEKLFSDVPGLEPPTNTVGPVKVDSTVVLENLEVRDQVVAIAKQYLGAPYVWAGNSPEGFDCSGFTGFVMSQVGVTLPRRSVDQFNDCEKVKDKNVQKGDLVFFNNGSGVSHVGIVISEKGEPVEMIHASSSKGIIITKISESDYWLNRVHGYGRIIQ